MGLALLALGWSRSADAGVQVQMALGMIGGVSLGLFISILAWQRVLEHGLAAVHSAKERLLSIIDERQALTFALRDIARVREADRAVARDRAAVQIREAAAALDALWRGEPMPEDLLERIEQAERAWRASAYPGLLELVWPGPGELVMPELVGEGGADRPGGTLLALAPGTVVLPGEPVALVAERPMPEIPGTEARLATELSQLYRTFDEEGRWTGSFRHPVDDELPAGMPMLLPLWVQGEPLARPMHSASEWLRMQRAAGITLQAWSAMGGGDPAR